jgi:two-component system cell cycle response regulator DivK
VDAYTETILIVEDNVPSRRLIEMVLRPLGYRLFLATNGVEAVNLARRENPDLILMDLQLPLLSGYDATRKLKQLPETCHIPVVALTAHTMREDQKAAEEAGCDGFIAKPISTRSLPQELRRYFTATSLP